MKYTLYVNHKLVDTSKTYKNVTEEDINKKIAEFVLSGWSVQPNAMRDSNWDEFNMSKDGWRIAFVIDWEEALF